MTTQIHPTAIVHPEARLEEGVKVGAFSIVESNVVVGAGTKIDSNVLVASGTRIGKDCWIAHGAVIGTIPQDLKFGGEESELVVGDRTIIREYVTLNRGTAHGRLQTYVGSDSMLMAYSHVAHDCRIGDHVIIANGVQMGGHVTIEDWASIGGLTAIHQFCRIGAHSFVGGRARVVKDIPPYILAAGEPLGYRGPNVVGLKRRGFNSQSIASIREVYRYIYRSSYNLTQALEHIRQELNSTPEVEVILAFISHSQRGIIGLKGEKDVESDL